MDGRISISCDYGSCIIESVHEPDYGVHYKTRTVFPSALSSDRAYIPQNGCLIPAEAQALTQEEKVRSLVYCVKRAVRLCVEFHEGLHPSGGK
jgi:hypothetical protein